jgi:hypothetical protein
MLLSLLMIESSAIVFSARATAAGLMLFACYRATCIFDNVSGTVSCSTAARRKGDQDVCNTIADATKMADQQCN